MRRRVPPTPAASSAKRRRRPIAATRWAESSQDSRPCTSTTTAPRSAKTRPPRGRHKLGGTQAGFTPVSLPYDRAEIREDARPALRSNADKLNAGNLGTVTVEGHCDERGSTEYNLALGERQI